MFLDNFYFGVVILSNIAIFHFWVMKSLKMNINLKKFLLYLGLIFILMIADIPYVRFSLLIWSIAYFYHYFRNLGRAWVTTLISICMISTSLFLSVDVDLYIYPGFHVYTLLILEFITYNCLLFLFSSIEKKYHILSYLEVVKNNQYFFLAGYTLVGILIVYMENYYLNKNDSYYFYMDIQFLILLLLLMIYMIYNILTMYRLNNALLEAQSFDKKEKYYQELDGFRHDFKALLFSLYATVEEQDIFAIKTVLDGMRNYSSKIVDFDQIFNISNKMVSGLLRELQHEAEEKKIKLKIVIPKPVSFFEINTFDLVRMLSIIINNAIEESEKEKSDVHLTILSENKTHTKIICKNKVRKKNNSDFNQLLNREYTEKNNHQGLGLWNFEKISMQYKNLFYKLTLDKVNLEFTAVIDIFE